MAWVGRLCRDGILYNSNIVQRNMMVCRKTSASVLWNLLYELVDLDIMMIQSPCQGGSGWELLNSIWSTCLVQYLIQLKQCLEENLFFINFSNSNLMFGWLICPRETYALSGWDFSLPLSFLFAPLRPCSTWPELAVSVEMGSLYNSNIVQRNMIGVP